MSELQNLMQSTGLWRASSIDGQYLESCPSGFEALDRELPGSGWPASGITELLHDHAGIGELRLLMPALAQLSHNQTRWILFVSPPYIPYAPALGRAGIDLARVLVCQPKNTKDYLWVMEKALSSQSCSAVITRPAGILDKQVRRLQVAAKSGNCWGVLFRPESAGVNASPAELRIRLRPHTHSKDHSALSLKVIKRHGRWESGDILLHFDDELHRPMPDFSELMLQPFQSRDFKAIRHTLTPQPAPPTTAIHEHQ